MATVSLGSKAVGSTVKLNESGTPQNYIVVHQGYPSSLYATSCNGTWLLRQDIYMTYIWNASNFANYSSAYIHSYLNSTFLARFDSTIQSAVIQAKIPYGVVASNGDSDAYSGSSGLSAKVFLLSEFEIGSGSIVLPEDGAKLSYFESGSGASALALRIGYLSGSAAAWWLRTPHYTGGTHARYVLPTGAASYATCSSTSGVRPALILDPTLLVTDDGTVTTNTAPTAPNSITLPSSIMGGTSIAISWTAGTDAEGNLEGYIVQRSIDGGSTWTQIYQGEALSTTNSVAFGIESVMYRVKAYDSEGLESAYKTSSQMTVINNNAPGAPGSITVPLTVLGGQQLTIAWGAAVDKDGNLEGYALERSVNSGTYEEIYRGAALSFADTITKGWNTVIYRVRAYDAYTAYSSYTTSSSRTVNNNTAPTITCSAASGSSLGEKSAGFSISYSVDDVDGDTVTVTEAVDGVIKRTFAATLGSSNSFAVTGDYFMKLLNGTRTITITASDGTATTIYTLYFTKAVTTATFTLEKPMEADDQITLTVLSVLGSIPSDADFTVEVTNNANDDSPVWEDCLNSVKTGSNYVFTNQTAANGFAYNFRVTIKRGDSGVGGYVTSIQGGFQ